MFSVGRKWRERMTSPKSPTLLKKKDKKQQYTINPLDYHTRMEGSISVVLYLKVLSFILFFYLKKSNLWCNTKSYLLEQPFWNTEVIIMYSIMGGHRSMEQGFFFFYVADSDGCRTLRWLLLNWDKVIKTKLQNVSYKSTLHI